MQESPAPSVPPQVLPPAGANSAPVMENSVNVSVAVPVLVTVAETVGLVASTLVLGNCTGRGVIRITGAVAMPVPVSCTVALTSPLIVSVPVRVPPAVGEKTTDTVQVPAGAIAKALVQVLAETAKSPVMVTPGVDKFSVSVPELRTVTTMAALDDP